MSAKSTKSNARFVKIRQVCLHAAAIVLCAFSDMIVEAQIDTTPSPIPTVSPTSLCYSPTEVPSSTVAGWQDYMTDADGDGDRFDNYGERVCTVNYFKAGLSGSLPTEFGLMTTITNMVMGQNSFTGTIPTELGMLLHVTRLATNVNSLHGTLPTQLGALSSITNNLNILENSHSGTIPTELGRLSASSFVHLGTNLLTGSIPTQLGQLTDSLYLRSNSLTGAVPTQLGQLSVVNVMAPNYVCDPHSMCSDQQGSTFNCYLDECITPSPTVAPTTSPPTRMPSSSPTLIPSSMPTSSPTLTPPAWPTSGPTARPSARPTHTTQTDMPSVAPSFASVYSPSQGDDDDEIERILYIVLPSGVVSAAAISVIVVLLRRKILGRAAMGSNKHTKRPSLRISAVEM